MDINGNNMDTNRTSSAIYSPVVVLTPKKARLCDKNMCERHKNKVMILAIGILIGFMLCMGYIVWTMIQRMIQRDTAPAMATELQESISNITNTSYMTSYNTINGEGQGDSIDMTSSGESSRLDPPTRRRMLYVGVLTLEPYLDSRATACNETWGQNDKIDKLEFYAEVGDHRSHSTIGLVDIPDSSSADAWHTEKAFKMLEHMCRDHGDQYDWFLRAVDDSYINVDRLWHFLDKIDKTKKIMLGHHTLPIDDTSYKALNGRGYCIGGPGLIFSRPLLKSMCPNLADCRKRFSHLPADVAIAKCISETVGIECAFVPELHPYFVHSFEKNQFHLLDEFTNNPLALTYHPLKSTWMMRSLHEHIIRSKLEEAIVQLDDLQMTKVSLKKQLGQKDDSSLWGMKSPYMDGSFLTSNGQGLTVAGCSPSYQLTQEETEDIDDAVHFAKTSIQWGKLQSCHKVLSSYTANIQDKSVVIVDMICNELHQPSQPSLARAIMTKSLGIPYLKEHRTWKTSRHLIVVIEADIDDPHLVDFILKLYHLSMKIEQKIILSIIETSEKVQSGGGRRDQGSRDYLLKDLKHWYNGANIDLHIHHYNEHKAKPKPVVYSDVMIKLYRTYPDATVLFTSINLDFDEWFLQRCSTIVRQGRQVYSPHPMQQLLIDRGVNEAVMMSVGVRPLCVHIKDFIPERPRKRKRRNRQKGLTKEPLKVNTALDVNLHIVIPTS